MDHIVFVMVSLPGTSAKIDNTVFVTVSSPVMSAII